MSIQVNELRIGNWVMVSDNYRKNDIIQVSSINVSGIELDGDHYGEAEPGYYSSMINPIILTPRLLKKCGFERKVFGQDKATIVYGKSYCREGEEELVQCLCILLDENTKPVSVIQNDYTNMRVALNSCEYVHQLQNLYFSLTGQELSTSL